MYWLNSLDFYSLNDYVRRIINSGLSCVLLQHDIAMVQHYARKRLDLSVPDDIGDMRVRIWKQLKHISNYRHDRLDNLI